MASPEFGLIPIPASIDHTHHRRGRRPISSRTKGLVPVVSDRQRLLARIRTSVGTGRDDGRNSSLRRDLDGG
jgi:hypothetical protein